ncbi:hypothetical protein BY458DRAFT_584877 [Sporodiniella umbellata]|nr:hypothetical protein BY458DRAFT_584877 [Sporodiniella umbellata]
MSFAYYQLRCLGTRCVSANFTRQFTTTTAYRQSQTLSDERFQTLLETLDKRLKVEDNTLVLLETIESFRPKKKVLLDKDYEKLYNLLDKSYNRKQLAEYLESKQIQSALKSKTTKKNMLTAILQNTWNIRTQTQLIEEKRRRVTEHFPATRQELFFVIGDNGDMLRKIEKKNDVNITIDVSKYEYLMEGQPAAVQKAKIDIASYLNISEGHTQVPKEVLENKDLQSEVIRLLTDVSKVSGSYISLNEDKFIFSSLSESAMDNAKRLLNLALTELKVTHKKPLNEADKTMAQSNSQFSLMPFYDPRSMSVYNQHFGWSKFKKNSSENSQLEFTDLDCKKSATLDKLNGMLLEGLGESEHKDVLLEARLGHVLCKNPTQPKMMPNLLQPASGSNMDFQKLAYMHKQNRTQFFNAMPPFSVLQYISPLSFEEDFYQRSIKVEYVSNTLLANSSNRDGSGLSRLELEFNVEEQGDMKLRSIVGEKQRSVMNILGISDCLDAQLTAKHIIKDLEEDMQELITKCYLSSYTELQAPIYYKDMTLLDISYIGKKQFKHKDNLLSVNRIEEQDSKLKKTEMLISSPYTDLSDSATRWKSFVNTLVEISNKWKL